MNTFLFACLFFQKSKNTLMEKIRQKYSRKWSGRQTLFFLPVFSFRRVKISDGEDQTEVFRKVAWETNTFLFAYLFFQKSKNL